MTELNITVNDTPIIAHVCEDGYILALFIHTTEISALVELGGDAAWAKVEKAVQKAIEDARADAADDAVYDKWIERRVYA